MAAVFETWTVLPHKPIEKLEANLWRVEGMLKTVQRAMVVARMKDGRLVIHNAIALDDGEMQELERFGEPAVLVVPNGFHRQDAKIWKDRYPKMRVFCPAGATGRVRKVVAVDGDYAQAPSDDTVRLAHLASFKNGEGILEVKSGERATLVFNDALSNIAATGGITGFALSPTGRVSVPRVMRWLAMKSGKDAAAELGTLAGTPGLARIVFGHGKSVEGDAAGELRGAASIL